MANLSPIENYISEIRNAVYGEQVRSSIIGAITACYTDVDDSKTLAATAADSANTAATTANGATSDANAKITEMNNKISGYNTLLRESINPKINRMQTLIESCEGATGKATEAATSASTEATNMSNRITAYDILLEESINPKISRMEGLITSCEEATGKANTATTNADTAAGQASTAAENANLAREDCERKTQAAISATTTATNAGTRASTAANAIGNLSVSSENVPPDTPASVNITKDPTTGYPTNLHFLLRQGQVGPAYRILGDVYATASQLEAAISSPAIGDQYYVGTELPYSVYRWTGTRWENDGPMGISFDDITNEELDSLWGGTELSGTVKKYINHVGLYYLLNTLIKAGIDTKVTKEDGKGLSTNDFTNAYKQQVDDNTTDIGTLSESKVTKVPGKDLSTNDFSNDYKQKVDDNATKIGSVSLQTAARDLSNAVNELIGRINTKGTVSTIDGIPAVNGDVFMRGNENMIVNWWFATGNIINQRGVTDLTNDTSTYTPFCDCIRFNRGHAYISDDNHHLVWDSTKNDANFKRIQFMCDKPVLSGATYTIALVGKVIDVGGNAYLRLCNKSGAEICSNSTRLVKQTSFGIQSVTFQATASAEHPYVEILVGRTAADFISVDFSMVKLEIGPQQTAYVRNASGTFQFTEIPNYADALARCQKYYIRMTSGAAVNENLFLIHALTEKIAIVTLPLPTVMYKQNPTAVYSNMCLRLGITDIDIPEGAISASWSPTGVRLQVNFSENTLTAGTTYIMFAKNGYLDLVNEP